VRGVGSNLIARLENSISMTWVTCLWLVGGKGIWCVGGG